MPEIPFLQGRHRGRREYPPKVCVYDQLQECTSQALPLLSSDMHIVAYRGNTIQDHGICKLGVRHQDQFTETQFYVTETQRPILVGLPTSRSLGLVSLNFNLGLHTIERDSSTCLLPAADGDPHARARILEEYKDVFTGIVCFEGKHKIVVDPAVPPVVHPPHRIPMAIKNALKDELDSLAEQDIITPVTFKPN